MKLYQTINFSISVYKLMLHSYIIAFTCEWYVVSTYHSIVKVFHVTDTYRMRMTPSTDPDWDGTATKQTDIHSLFYSSI